MDEEMANNHIGTITKVELTNFMAYDHITFYPGSYLNIILGANGTGKSSIICGIVLGLGGKPKTIGRTAQLKDYVNTNNGAGKAKVTIELANPGYENYIVQREFNTENRTYWHLNGNSVSQKEIDVLMKTLNIQVDNLCQFLPQDKVQDFAKMNAQQLLENTVKTVGSNEMIEWHNSLVNMRRDEGDVQKILEAKMEELEREKHKLNSLENEAKFVRERNEHLQSLELMNQKKAWTMYGETENEMKEIAGEREDLLKLKRNAEAEVKPYELAVKKATEEVRSTDLQLTEAMNKIGTSQNVVQKTINEMNRLEETITRINRELQAALQSVKSKEQEINKLVQSISVFESTAIDPAKEKELERKTEDIQLKLKTQITEVRNLMAAEDSLKHELRSIENSRKKTEVRLSSANDVAKEKFNAFRRRHSEAYELMMWLKDNRHRFRGRVFDPIQLEINVRPEFARYVEHVLPSRDLEAFVCEFNEDVSTLLRVARMEKNLSINAISAEAVINAKYKPAMSINNLSTYGFQCYVMDNIEGPQSILNYLCKTYNLHNVPIGTKATEAMLDSIPRNITNFFAEDNHYSIRVSKYSGEKVSRVTGVRSQVKVFINSLDNELVQALKNTQEMELSQLSESQNKLQQVRNQLQVAEQLLEKLKNEKRDVSSKLIEFKSARSNVNMKKEELRILRSSTVQPEALEKRAKQQIAECVVQIVVLQKKIEEGINEYSNNAVLKSKILQKKLEWADCILKKRKHSMAENMTNLEAAKRDLRLKEDELAKSQREVKASYEAARQATNGLTPKDKAFKEKFVRKFKELPDYIEELQTAIQRAKAKIDCMGQGRHSAIEEYEKQVKKVQTLERELAAPELDLNSIKRKMEDIKAKWMTSVMKLVSQINEKYSLFFERMQCVGEVSLYKPTSEDNYQDYGISIKVKFRNDDRLKELGPFKQSGGERAVATAVYMLALQHLTTVPFRCVDEINQGMDEKNERIVYKLLMETTEDAAAGQCFLLTPKLLKNLEYSEKTTVSLIIKSEGDANLPRLKNSLKRKHVDSDSS